MAEAVVPEYITTVRASRILGVTAQSVRNYAADGRLRIAAKASDGTLLFDAGDVARLKRERARAARKSA
jgi:hypothetical protein